MISSASSLSINFYEVLGLNENECDVNDLKKAYRRLALRWHPDKNPANFEEASGRFEKISEAYQILSNPQTRQIYDRLRLAALVTSSTVDGNSSVTSSAVAPPVVGDENESLDRLGAEFGRMRLKAAQQVFEEFFGGRNPFNDMLAFGSDSSVVRNGRRFDYQETPTRRCFPCLDEPKYATTPSERVFAFSPLLEDSPDGAFNQEDIQGVLPFGPVSPPPNHVTSSIRHVTTSTRISNGRKIVTKKVVENGVDILTIEENGKLVKKVINGSEVSVDESDDLDPESPLT